MRCARCCLRRRHLERGVLASRRRFRFRFLSVLFAVGDNRNAHARRGATRASDRRILGPVQGAARVEISRIRSASEGAASLRVHRGARGRRLRPGGRSGVRRVLGRLGGGVPRRGGARTHGRTRSSRSSRSGTTKATLRFDRSRKKFEAADGGARNLVRRRVRPSLSPSALDKARAGVGTPSRPRRSARGRVCREASRSVYKCQVYKKNLSIRQSKKLYW